MSNKRIWTGIAAAAVVACAAAVAIVGLAKHYTDTPETSPTTTTTVETVAPIPTIVTVPPASETTNPPIETATAMPAEVAELMDLMERGEVTVSVTTSRMLDAKEIEALTDIASRLRVMAAVTALSDLSDDPEAAQDAARYEAASAHAEALLRIIGSQS